MMTKQERAILGGCILIGMALVLAFLLWALSGGAT